MVTSQANLAKNTYDRIRY